MTNPLRTAHFCLLLVTASTLTFSQSVDPSAPSKEYIRLGGQIIAIENGQANAPGVGLSPTSLTFTTAQNVGTSSAPLAVTLTNSGTASLTISSVVIGGANAGDFNSVDTCAGQTIVAQGKCTITVTFTPTAGGTRTADVSITDNAASSPQSVPLNGTGLSVPMVKFTPPSLSFGDQNVGVASASQTVTLSNIGTATLSISSINAGGTYAADYAVSNTCGSSLAAGASCPITVVFTPSAAGSNRSASILVADNATGSPQSAALTGNGIAPGVTLLPTSLSFGDQNVGTTAAAKTVKLTNSGTAPLAIGAIAVSGTNASDFALTANTCGTSVAVGASCVLTATFTPSTMGNRGASISISDNAASSPQSVPLSGNGTLPGFTPSTTSLAFGSQNTGTNTVKTLTVTNSGTGPLTVSAVTVTGPNAADFSSTNNCIATIAAGGMCSVTVTFNPAVVGGRSSTLTFTDNAAGSPQTFALTGTGTMPMVTLSATSLGFGSQNTGTTSASRSVTLTNSGTGPLTIASVSLGGANPGDFAVSANTCGATVVAGVSCTLSVTFKPTATGSRAASLVLTDNAAGSPQALPLTGTGTMPVVSLSVTSLGFPNENVGTPSPAQTVTLKNIGTGALTISSVAIGGGNPGDFAVTANNCGTTVAVSGSCTISVDFKPTMMGSRGGSLLFTDNAAGSPQMVTLSGTGLAPVVTLSATSLKFAGQNTGTASASQTVTLKNTGTAALNVSSVVVSGANAGDFVLACGCNGVIAINASCTLTVVFKPTGTGTRTASLLITDNAAGSPQAITLTGTGTAPVVTLSPGSLGFGTVRPGTTSAPQTVTVSNTGTGPLTIGGIGVIGPYASCFRITANSCGSGLAAGASCRVTVVYQPANSKVQTASLSITDNAAGSPQTVGLSGQ